MATLKNTTINDTGFVTVPSGAPASRPTTGTVTTSTTRPIGISANGLRLFICPSLGAATSGYWSVYQNLPAYLTGLPTTTIINNTDSGTFTINFPARVYMLRNPAWNAVDITGWTLVESNTTYILDSSGLISVYRRDFAAGTHAYDDNSAMYMWDFGTNVAVRNGMTFYNTSNQSLEFFNVTGWRSQIVTQGLVCYIDAGNRESYPGWGVTYKDLSGSGRIGQSFGAVTWSDTFGGVAQFSGASPGAGYIRVPDTNLATGQYTVMGAARYTGANRGRIITSLNNNWLLGHWNAQTENYYAEGWVTAAGNGPNDTNWRIYAGLGDTVADSYTMYSNNTLIAGPNNGGAAGPNGLSIGAFAGTSEFTDGQFGFVLCYNRLLSVAEMTQNYNFFRGRYGL